VGLFVPHNLEYSIGIPIAVVWCLQASRRWVAPPSCTARATCVKPAAGAMTVCCAWETERQVGVCLVIGQACDSVDHSLEFRKAFPHGFVFHDPEVQTMCLFAGAVWERPILAELTPLPAGGVSLGSCAHDKASTCLPLPPTHDKASLMLDAATQSCFDDRYTHFFSISPDTCSNATVYWLGR